MILLESPSVASSVGESVILESVVAMTSSTIFSGLPNSVFVLVAIFLLFCFFKTNVFFPSRESVFVRVRLFVFVCEILFVCIDSSCFSKVDEYKNNVRFYCVLPSRQFFPRPQKQSEET